MKRKTVKWVSYFQKLKDPRWQKKRLEILKRDEWQCTNCGDEESTLHVHHTYYKSRTDPWEYPNESLHSLCEDCHKKAGDLGEKLKGAISAARNDHRLYGYAMALASDCDEDAEIIPLHDHEIASGACDALEMDYDWLLDDADIFNEIRGKDWISRRYLISVREKFYLAGKKRRREELFWMDREVKK